MKIILKIINDSETSKKKKKKFPSLYLFYYDTNPS